MNQLDTLKLIAEQVNEIAARCRRTETSLHKVREHLGMDSESDPVHVIDAQNVVVRGYDVTLSQIRNALLSTGVFAPHQPISIKCGDRVVAAVSFGV